MARICRKVITVKILKYVALRVFVRVIPLVTKPTAPAATPIACGIQVLAPVGVVIVNLDENFLSFSRFADA
jgi:hypothetical protein